MRPRLLSLLRWTLLARTAVGTVGTRTAIGPSILALALTVAVLLAIALLAVAAAFKTTLLLPVATIAIAAPITTATPITTAAPIAALMVAARIALGRRRLPGGHGRGLHRDRCWRGGLEY